MLKKNAKIIFGSIFFIAAIVTLSSFEVDPGPKGCIITPGDLKGYCLKNTENTYDCIVSLTILDCTSSN
jgi:hypothetical protein